MRRRGFTLVECLVVIAVVALLMGLLLPTLTASKDRARSLVCQANLKHNAAATLMFTENEGFFPFGFCSSGGFSTAPPGGFLGDGAKDWRGWWWFHQIAEGQTPEQNTSLHCPSQPQTSTLLCGNYGANYSIYKIGDSMSGSTEFFGEPLKAARLSRPGRTLLLADSGYTLISWKAVSSPGPITFENAARLDTFYMPGLASNVLRTIAPDQQTDAAKGRHPRHVVNVTCADGNVRSLKASLLTVSDPDADASDGIYRWRP